MIQSRDNANRKKKPEIKMLAQNSSTKYNRDYILIYRTINSIIDI